jgi:tripartite-type tricarboxylate transporter receptor subunit TctC
VNRRSTVKLATTCALSLFVGVSGLTTASYALDDLRIIAPAKPGGGWD